VLNIPLADLPAYFQRLATEGLKGKAKRQFTVNQKLMACRFMALPQNIQPETLNAAVLEPKEFNQTLASEEKFDVLSDEENEEEEN